MAESATSDALLVIDAINTFQHEDGDALLAAFRQRADGMVAAIAGARARDIPVIYVNDAADRWDGDAPGTPLALLLERLEIDRVLLAGAATEGCVVQSGIDARELGLKATILLPACATVDEGLESVALAYAERVAAIRVERRNERSVIE